jgi:reactive intermediate/imine deaminase
MARHEGRTENAPKPVAAYSQAIRVGNVISIAGQCGFDPKTGELVAGGVGSETLQALRNADEALKSCGVSLDDVVRVDVILADISEFPAMNDAYGTVFSAPCPTRTTIGAQLVGAPRVEITVLAVAEDVR